MSTGGTYGNSPLTRGAYGNSATGGTLTANSITFGKYKGQTLERMLRDRKYCEWLLQQDWFKQQYGYLYTRVKEYEPRKLFMTRPPYPGKNVQEFLDKYEYFYMATDVPLSKEEGYCYKFYRSIIQSLKEKIEDNLVDANPYDIKAPSNWLKEFERKYGMPRETFKEFLAAYDLPSIASIVEDIKGRGNIVYKGAKSFSIAKENSKKQEKYWEDVLKKVYKEEIGTQFKFGNCIFDFIHIKKNVLFECKLGMKDFNKVQYEKYLSLLNNFRLVYLIGTSCIVDMGSKTIYTTEGYTPRAHTCELEALIQNYTVLNINTVEEYFKVL